MRPPTPKPKRLLVVMPSWIGDAVMATPALRRLRDALPGALIAGLVRPEIEQILNGLDVLDEFHVHRPGGVMYPKRAAAQVRNRRYDTALLLTNSFSTALIARLAFIRRRIGYQRDGRAVLLTDRLEAPKTAAGDWAIVPAPSYYWAAAEYLVTGVRTDLAIEHAACDRAPLILPADARMELATTNAERADARALLKRAGIDAATPYAVLNPGGNNPAKRWPPDRFACIADHLQAAHGLRSVLNGSPAERELLETIARASHVQPAILPDHGSTLRTLKPVVRGARLMVTNDTGPRHVAAALGTPVVSLFGPTDPRWTTIPFQRERLVLADPALPPGMSANDHPRRCAIDKIEIERVRAAVDELLAG